MDNTENPGIRYRAVLTGDIVGSSRLIPTQMESVRSSLTAAVKTWRQWKRGTVKGRMEFFRGDGWQLVLDDPRVAMRAAIFLRASLLAGGIADTRVSIGLGEGKRGLETKLALSTGPAFVLSGHGLDEMIQHWRMTTEISKAAGPLADWLRVVSHLCDSLINQWTRRQAELVSIAINPKEPDAETLAQALSPQVSKQAVSKGLRGANWFAIREAIRSFESTPWETVLRPANAADRDSAAY